ncbi:hypothetical protein [Micromonospora olivasterospora]|uniref:hypothetical protein n=1 Tax=Micromonospora olivasterospora TaxID=1880 RepID=UPI0014791F2E|nr:hypothetical protein [Micromonospora olivasterospora]
MTDPLLWRLAYDVASAHEPDENGRCRNLLCADQPSPCTPLVNAERALGLSRGAAPAQSPAEQTPEPLALPAQPVPAQRGGADREAA